MGIKETAVLAEKIVNHFAINGEFEGVDPYGSGHINDTFLSHWNQAGTTVRYIHQRINQKVFAHPDEVMENIQRVTSHIREKFRALGEKDWSRRALTVVPGKDGKLFFRDDEGGWWRTYLFIEKSHTVELTTSPAEARLLGASIGAFQKQLADLPPPRLFDAIPDFHNMEKRYLRFYEAVSKDVCGRAKDVRPEIDFMKANEERGGILIRSLREGKIPERITHNDTKMNNILVDDEDAKAVCVIDLDTVMPGTSLFDTGDLIRTVTNAAEEDERDLSKVKFDLEYFGALTEGYLSEALEFLTRGEYTLITESGRNLTHLIGLRFLTDYLEGDHYYHTSRPGHNLDRSRNQITLIRSIDKQWDEAEKIVRGLTAASRR